MPSHLRTAMSRGRALGMAAALCGAALLCFAFPAAAQIEIKLGHVGEPGSLFQKSADEYARRANESWPARQRSPSSVPANWAATGRCCRS